MSLMPTTARDEVFTRTDAPPRSNGRGRIVRFEAPTLTGPTREESASLWKAKEPGYDEGYAEGRRQAEAELRAIADEQRRAYDRLVRAAAALDEAAAQLARRDTIALADIEDDVVGMAVALATEIIGRELTVAEHPVIDAMARASKLVPDRGVPVVRVAIDDVEAARTVVDDETTAWSSAVEIVGDESLSPGDCIVDVGSCRVDAGIEAALTRMRAVLD